jgi:cytochrome c peroxidase
MMVNEALMAAMRLTAIAGAAGLAAGCLLLLAGTVVSRSNEGAPARDKWKADYHRPSAIPFPASNAYSEAKSRLGRMLFFDPVMSGSGSRACASCHNPVLSWQDNLPRGIGENQEPMAVRTPTLLNVAWVPKLAWDGHFRDLESVAFGPISNPKIMNMPEQVLVERLSAIPGYVSAFHAAFGPGDITKRKIELALATFERSIVSGEAPFDRWIKGDERAISDAAKRGFDLFNGKARCSACHSGWAFTDASFHDVGTATGDDIGRGRFFPTSVMLRYAFKTPTLRDVARRAPYMHDGSVTTLAEVIDLYDKGGIDRPSRATDVKPLGLTAREKADLMAFLKTLTAAPTTVALTTLPR